MTDRGRSSAPLHAAPGRGGERPARPIDLARRRRLSKTTLRLFAWIAGTAAFLTSWAVINLGPKPASGSAITQPVRQQRPIVLIHHVIRKIIIDRQSPSTGGVVSSGSSGGGVIYLPAPAAAPAVSTGGSHP